MPVKIKLNKLSHYDKRKGSFLQADNKPTILDNIFMSKMLSYSKLLVKLNREFLALIFKLF